MSLNVRLGAARAGVKSLSQSMGGEWGQYGVMINNIAPGVVYSDSAIANYGPLGNNDTLFNKDLLEYSGDTLFENSRKICPVGRLGRVYEDCVPPIIFMLTPGCTYVTGLASKYLSIVQ